MTYRAVLISFRSTIQYITLVLQSKESSSPYLFSAEVKPEIPKLIIFLNLQGIQQTFNKVIRSILNQTKNIKTWPTPMFESTIGKQDAKPEEKDGEEEGEGFRTLQIAQTQDLNPINFFGFLTRNNIVISLCLSTTSKMTDFNEVVQIYFSRF
jgi:hypothetical protein